MFPFKKSSNKTECAVQGAADQRIVLQIDLFACAKLEVGRFATFLRYPQS